MIIFPPEMKAVHEKAQQLFLDAGVSKVAEVLKNIFTETQLNIVAKSTRFPKKSFPDRENAEKWLEA